MFLSKVFLAGLLLVLCSNIGSAKGQNAYTEQQPPDFGQGFLPFVIKVIKEMFFKIRKDNSNSIQRITDDVNGTLPLIAADIRAIGNRISQIDPHILAMMNFGNSSEDLLEDALTVGVQRSASVANVLELFNVVQNTFNDVYQGSRRIRDDISYTIDNNVQFAKNLVTYIPTEVAKKLKMIDDRLVEISNVVQKIVLAARDQALIVVLQGAIMVVKVGLSTQRFIQNIFSQLEKMVNKIIILQSTLVHMLTTTINSVLRELRAF
ncbi:uncharacterized protein [Periplaneta americana]|uniref:uncharacterized protein n=1 Tax=Periplaneta americana TaxID=6978 RepID=UPI0037E99AEB